MWDLQGSAWKRQTWVWLLSLEIPSYSLSSDSGHYLYNALKISVIVSQDGGLIPGSSVVKNLPANAGDSGLIPGSGRSPGEGNDNPCQYSCLGNPMDRGAWQFIVHGATKSQTWLSTHAWIFEKMKQEGIYKVLSIPPDMLKSRIGLILFWNQSHQRGLRVPCIHWVVLLKWRFSCAVQPAKLMAFHWGISCYQKLVFKKITCRIL